MTPPLALICSVALEAEPVLRRLRGAEAEEIGRRPATRGGLAGRPVIVLPGGVGKTNAAQALTALLATRRVAGVIGFGVGGAYPGSELATGDLAVATEEIYGDEGVEAPGGWISTEGIGIPLLDRPDGDTYNRFALDSARVEAARRALDGAAAVVAAGPFVTVSSCSGTARRGEELARRFGAVCETMEGAAYAHVAALYELPFLEVRGISNPVEDRDLSRWRLREAAAAAATAAERLVAAWRE